MSWSIGYDKKWRRDIGYGVPAYCDHPDCNEKIDRGLSYVCCDSQPYGGEKGCGLYFCSKHSTPLYHMCCRCNEGVTSFPAKEDHPEWIRHKLTDDSWAEWRKENPDFVAKHSSISSLISHYGEGDNSTTDRDNYETAFDICSILQSQRLPLNSRLAVELVRQKITSAINSSSFVQDSKILEYLCGCTAGEWNELNDERLSHYKGYLRDACLQKMKGNTSSDDSGKSK